MTSWGKTKDAGAAYKAVFGSVETDVTAGGSGDNTEVNGAWIDRQGFESLDVLLAWTATLAADETIALAANLQDADAIDGTGVADVAVAYNAALASTVQGTGESGGSTETGVTQLGFDLTMCRRFVRVQFTPNLSAPGTDTAKVVPVYLLGGGIEEPANASRVNLRATP